MDRMSRALVGKECHQRRKETPPTKKLLHAGGKNYPTSLLIMQMVRVRMKKRRKLYQEEGLSHPHKIESYQEELWRHDPSEIEPRHGL